ncbi:MAG: hypothetical protein FJ279_27400 [Planctomycetes bacterium]|nr:hypothetical protein [Planctomycetota bacterium]
MSEKLSIQDLTDRLVRVEKEMGAVRKELADLRRQTRAATEGPASLWASNAERRRCARSLPIQGTPVGAKLLQQKMAQAGLLPNELSRGLVAAREE